MTVTLEIYTPQKVFEPMTADKIVLPVKEGNLTIINGRAPRSQVLIKGDIVLLDAQNQALQSFEINGGLAEIALDVCKVATEEIKTK